MPHFIALKRESEKLKISVDKMSRWVYTIYSRKETDKMEYEKLTKDFLEKIKKVLDNWH